MPVRFPPPEQLETYIPAPEWIGDGVYDDSSGAEESLAGFWDSESSFFGDGYPLVHNLQSFDADDGRSYFESMRDITQLPCPSADFEKSLTLSDLVDPDDDDFHSFTEPDDVLDTGEYGFEHQKANLFLRLLLALVSRVRGHHSDDEDDAAFRGMRQHSHASTQQSPSAHDLSEQALKSMNKSAGQGSTRGGALMRYSGA